MNIGDLKTRYDIYKILSLTNVQKICEVGVDHGWNLTNLCKCKPKLAVAIDIWDEVSYYDFYTKEFHERNYKEIIRRSLEENRCILPIRMDSIKAADIFPDEFFEFIYIDAAHDYNSVSKNIKAYWSKLATGRYLAGHDYFDGFKDILPEKLRLPKDHPIIRLEFGVKSAVDEFASSVGSKVEVIKDDNGIDSWAIKK
jgi:hypothetical protein